MAVIHNQPLPFWNEDLDLSFAPPVTIEDIRLYLRINGLQGEYETVTNDLIWELDGKLARLDHFDNVVNRVLIKIPVGIKITDVEWLEPATERVKLVQLHDNKTGEPIYPVTHIKGVLGSNGESLESIINGQGENLDELLSCCKIVNDKLLKILTSYLMTEIVVDSNEGYFNSLNPVQTYLGDTIAWGGSPDGIFPPQRVGLMDADHNVLVSPSENAWEYRVLDDKLVYFFSENAIQQTPYRYDYLAVRAGGGSGGSDVDFTKDGFNKYVNFVKESTGDQANVPTLEDYNLVRKEVIAVPYSDGIQFYAGDITMYNGVKYRALQNAMGKNPLSNPDYWQPLELGNDLIHWEYLDAVVKAKINAGGGGGSVAVDDVTIEDNVGIIGVKDAGITLNKLAQEVKDQFGGAPDDITIEKNADNKLQAKDGGITINKLAEEVQNKLVDVDDATIEQTPDHKLKVKDDVFLKEVKVDGVKLTKTNCEVEIPKASATQYGIIKIAVDGETLKITL